MSKLKKEVHPEITGDIRGGFKMEGVINRVFKKIEVSENKREIVFTRDDDATFKMYNIQDGYEDVYIEEIIGDLNDLIGYKILQYEEVIKEYDTENMVQWTFYKFATIKGYVTLRWYGFAGYYSVNVTFEEQV